MAFFPVNSTNLQLTILRKLKNGKILEKNELVSILAKEFKLTVSQKLRKDPISKKNSWDGRVRWELSWLRTRGLIKNVRLGHFHITPLGKDIIRLCESFKRNEKF